MNKNKKIQICLFVNSESTSNMASVAAEEHPGLRRCDSNIAQAGWCLCHEQIIHDGIHKFPQQIVRIPAAPISPHAKPETKPPTQTKDSQF